MKRSELTKQKFRIVIVAGIILFGLSSYFYIYKYLWNMGKKTYNLKVEVNDTGSLSVGTPALMNGVKVGAVDDVFLDEASVIVSLSIYKNVRIPIGSIVKINFKGMIGDLVVNIFRPSQDKDDYLRDGDLMKGTGPVSPGAILETATDLAKKVDQVISDVAKMDIEKLSKNIEEFTVGANTVVDRINEILKDFDEQGKKEVFDAVNNIGELAKEFREVINGDSFSQTVVNVEDMTGDLSAFFNNIRINASIDLIFNNGLDAKNITHNTEAGIGIYNLYFGKVNFDKWDKGYSVIFSKQMPLLTVAGGLFNDVVGLGAKVDLGSYVRLGALVSNIKEVRFDAIVDVVFKGFVIEPKYNFRDERFEVKIGYGVNF